ncbi:putative mandelate racemase / muconate lactonizing enzyme [Klebsiella pneumoniae]|uniref:Putative mandelate racemase / muconate lactonizing enzyme n=1 Tax=Klebsiella pneumoniae TaxID=573 RepID=A0A378FWE4_KLEPN|nr:putative mandelate racemase / muconate lactonizing enzyme [Klebsiella pneumoniae]
MKVAALAESFGMDCEVHGNGAASLAVVGRDPQLPAGTSAAWLHPFLDYDEPAAYLNSMSTRWMTRDLCICHNVRVSVKTLILRISKPIPLATTDLKK